MRKIIKKDMIMFNAGDSVQIVGSHIAAGSSGVVVRVTRQDSGSWRGCKRYHVVTSNKSSVELWQGSLKSLVCTE